MTRPFRVVSGKGPVILTPRATRAGFGALAFAALAAATAGVVYSPALPFGLGALTGVAAAFAVVRSTFARPLAALGGASEPHVGPVERLKAVLARREADRDAAVSRARAEAAEAARAAAQAEAQTRQRDEAARAATARALSAALKNTRRRRPDRPARCARIRRRHRALPQDRLRARRERRRHGRGGA